MQSRGLEYRRGEEVIWKVFERTMTATRLRTWTVRVDLMNEVMQMVAQDAS